MIRQCAWCLKLMGEVAPLKDTSVTHGICEKCEEGMKKEIMRLDEKVRKHNPYNATYKEYKKSVGDLLVSGKSIHKAHWITIQKFGITKKKGNIYFHMFVLEYSK